MNRGILIRSAAGAHPDLLLHVPHRHNSPHKDIKTNSTDLSCFCSHSPAHTSQLSGYSTVNTGILPAPTERSPDTTWLLISWLYSKQHSPQLRWIVGKESRVSRGLGGKVWHLSGKAVFHSGRDQERRGEETCSPFLISLIEHRLHPLTRHSLSEGAAEEDWEVLLLMHR